MFINSERSRAFSKFRLVEVLFKFNDLNSIDIKKSRLLKIVSLTDKITE